MAIFLIIALLGPVFSAGLSVELFSVSVHGADQDEFLSEHVIKMCIRDRTNTRPDEPDKPNNPDEPDKPEEPDVPPPTLPQTGLLWWPVPLLMCSGLLLLAAGLIVLRRQRDTDEK